MMPLSRRLLVMACWRQLQILLALLLFTFAHSATLPNQKHQQTPQKYFFSDNCADEHDKEYVSCTVSAVDCNVDLEKLIPTATDGNSIYPTEAHDVRIEPFAKAMPKRDSENGQNHHQLRVDISWQTPPNNSTHALKAFLLEIEGENGRKHSCFLLNLSDTEWTHEKVAQSPRLHFSSNSLFGFSQNYDIELYSLPEKSAGTGASVHARFTTPHNPNAVNSSFSSDLISDNCTKHSNQFASKWTAGFRHIYVHSAARVMQVQFVGAPPQYCFESYEVRLLDETGLELLYSGTVSIEDMQRNGNMILGQYNFTDLEYDKVYIPSVIPVERAVDGRCLCPVFGIDPYDDKVVCSCVAADWRPIRMTRPDIVAVITANESNLSPPLDYKSAPDHNRNGMMWPLLVIFNVLFLLLLCVFLIGYMHCRASGTIPQKGQFQTIRFVSPMQKGPLEKAHHKDSDGGVMRHPNPTKFPSAVTSSLAIRTNFGLGTVSSTSLMSTPLISAEESDEAVMNSGRPLNLLIVYAHDSEAHNRAVAGLAELLRDVFGLNITLDRWDLEKIENNLIDWLSASVVAADKVLVINSAGTWERYQAKAFSRSRCVVEKIDSDPLDHIFAAHIDMALQHHSIVSIRFSYTQPGQTLPMLNGLLQYNLPANICPLISAIFGRNMRHDPRLTPSALSSCAQMIKLSEAIDEMAKLSANEPNWLAETHHRRRLEMNEAMEGETQSEEVTGEEHEEVGEDNEREEAVSVDNMDTLKRAQQLDLIPFSYLANSQQNSAKLDSGIFEWSAGDENSGATTSGQADESAVVNSELVCENCAESSETVEACITHTKMVGYEKLTAQIPSQQPGDAQMDSGLVADDPSMDKTEEHSPMMAAV